MTAFIPFPKIPRLSREAIVTEKIDGTNASVFIGEAGEFLCGSRTRWVTPGKEDNHGFAGWAYDHKEDLLKLGPGHHFGEWWGRGIQRGYNQVEKKFSLFNTRKWLSPEAVLPSCVGVVPVIFEGLFDAIPMTEVLDNMRKTGSVAAPGYPFPEGVVIFHIASRALFKKTLEKDDESKGKN